MALYIVLHSQRLLTICYISVGYLLLQSLDTLVKS